MRRALDDIRYGQAVELADRDHEVLSQWIPRNLQKGWIRPISRELAGAAAVEAATVYDHARWDRLARRGHHLAGVPDPSAARSAASRSRWSRRRRWPPSSRGCPTGRWSGWSARSGSTRSPGSPTAAWWW